MQLGYDPCQCKTPSTLQIEFTAIKELDVDLEQRQISIEQDITKLNETQKEWLQYSAGNPGNVIYKSIDNLLADYNTSLEKYETDLKEYEKIKQKNALIKTTMTALGSLAGEGFTAIVPTAGLASFVLKQQLELWGTKYPADGKEAEKIAEGVKGTGKKLLADGFDFLTMTFSANVEKPTPPSTGGNIV